MGLHCITLPLLYTVMVAQVDCRNQLVRLWALGMFVVRGCRYVNMASKLTQRSASSRKLDKFEHLFYTL